jgi:antitoxin (DNA-binding transcriptional repressor) of toxin-antitoxin stability system
MSAQERSVVERNPFRRFADMQVLRGKDFTITMMDFRKQPGDIMDLVIQGATVTVTRQGKPIAVIHAPEPTALQLGAEVRRLGLVK